MSISIASIVIHHDNITKRFLLANSYPVKDFYDLIIASFEISNDNIDGHDDDIIINGLRDFQTGNVVPLSHICQNPAGYHNKQFGLVFVNSNNTNAYNTNFDNIPQGISKFENVVGQMLSLSNVDIQTMMHIFNTNALSRTRSGTTAIDRKTFMKCFEEYIGPLQDPSSAAREVLKRQLSRLFDLFDRDGNGVVDSREFLSGLSVLCGGDRDEKIRAAFNLYDKDGNGFIDREEMESYLSSVFSVIAESSPEVFQQHGVSPAELGAITAMQCFSEADTDGDGKISWSEFAAWYSDDSKLPTNPPSSVPNASQNQLSRSSSSAVWQERKENSRAGNMQLGSLEYVRDLTGLGEFPAVKIFNVFATAARSDGYLSFASFDACIKSVMAAAGKSYDTKEARTTIQSLFKVFDVDGNGKVDFEELASGLSVLTKGTRDEKIEAAFTLFDADGNGLISKSEMTSYLSSVFRLLYETSPGTLQQMGVTPEELGAITAEQCFKEADTDNSGGISLEEFKAWYARPSELSANHISSLKNSEPISVPDWVSLGEVRRLTGLSYYQPEDVFEAFASMADTNGNLNRKAFIGAFRSLVPSDYLRTPSDKERAAFIIGNLFDIMDSDNNGFVDFAELSSGISALTGGQSNEKVEAMFTLYDIDGDGFITPDEMEKYLTGMFRVLLKTLPDAREKLFDVRAEELARATTIQCFQDADINRDGKLDMNEFIGWYLSGNSPIPSSSTTNGNIKNEKPLFSLEEIRSLSGLSEFSIEDIFEEVARAADSQGLISKSDFFELLSIFKSKRNSNKQRYNEVISSFFDLFDPTHQGKVDFCEIASGLSVVAGGNREAKASSAFALYDYNGDGYISKDELERYLRCVFIVMYATGANKNSNLERISPNELAKTTTIEIFNENDLDGDSRLSFNEFSRWYEGTDNDSNTSNIKISLADIRRITNLGKFDAEDVFEQIAFYVNSQGEIDRNGFNKAFSKIIDPSSLSSEDRKNVDMVVNRLFDIFDTDKSGAVDFSELSTGLSVLCKGSKEDRSRAAFALYDINNDGFISLDEMERYLKSIYLIMYQTEGGVSGITPEQLAKATAEQIFIEADLNEDGRLSYDEFSVWISGGSEYSNVAVGNVSNENQIKSSTISSSSSQSKPLIEGDSMTISDLSRLTNLISYSPEEAFEHYAKYADNKGELSRSAFSNACKDIVVSKPGVKLHGQDITRRNIIMDNLFDIFDKDGNGVVDFVELSAGLSVLCGGSREEKVKSVFELYDANGDGVISLDEMKSYLESVYRVLYATNPNVKDEMGVSEEELAAITAESAFVEADLNEDGCLSFDEFKKWYESSQKPTSNAIKSVVEATPTWVNIEEVQRLTGLNQLQPKQVSNLIKRFSSNANAVTDTGDGALTRSAFINSLSHMSDITKGAGSPRHSNSQEDKKRLEILSNRLFDIFDSNRDGLLDFSEIASGLTILAKGNHNEKAEAAFSLFDYNNDGVIDHDELVRYLRSVFNIMYELQPGVSHEMEVSPEQLALATADEIFREFDIDHNGVLSLEEFTSFYAKGDTMKPGVASAAARMSQLAPQTFSFEEVRNITGLKNFEPDEVFEVFALAANNRGELDRQAFYEGFGKISLITSKSENDREKLRLVLDKLFNLFDVDKSGLISFDELSAGLSILCQGTRESRARVAFDLFDVNADGYLSRNELETYLVSVFRMMYGVGYSINGGYLSPEELGKLTADSVFDEMDLNHDGRISFDEFQKFYSTSTKSTEGLSTKNQSKGTNLGSNENDWMSLDEARRLTNLGGKSPEDVFELFALASPDGTISYDSFKRVFRDIVNQGPPLSAQDKSKLDFVLNKLFQAFDRDGNGTLDFVEIASGLSVLCGGGISSKAEASFALYDYNGDGYISQDELERYLTSVFTVLYETQPGTEAAMGASVSELAQATAIGIMKEADTNKDGFIDFNEFTRWFLSSSGKKTSKIVETIPSSLSLQEIRRITGLENFSVTEVFDQLAQSADTKGELNRPAFFSAFDGIIPADRLSSLDIEKLRLVLNRLFEIFDSDGNGVVDFQELASGLSVLAGGNRDDKVKSAFELYDIDGDGYIQHPELVKYLTSVYRLMFETNPAAKEKVGGISAEELAKITAEDIFAEADTNHDGKIDFEEFQRWISSGSGRHLSSLGQLAENAIDFPEVRRITGLERYNPEEAFEIVALSANQSGTLSKHAFFEAFEKIAQPELLDENDRGKLRTVLNKLFKIMDSDGNGTVDFSELASGLSVLCAGTREERVSAAFQLYDLNGDGFVSLDEMISYLTGVFKVLYETVPGTAESVGVSPKELAIATAETAFMESDLNHDGKLSYEEFAAWFNEGGGSDFAPEINQNQSASTSSSSSQHENKPISKQSRPAVTFQQQQQQQQQGEYIPQRVRSQQRSGSLGTTLPLQDLRRLTKLGMYEVDDVLGFFASVNGGRGSLTLPVFIRCFDELIQQSGGHDSPEDARVAMEVVTQLFTTFDEDHNSVVDFRELASGLSVLCSGKREDKVRAAFELYDTDGDGYLDLEGMVAYMTSVFKVLYRTTPEVGRQMKMTPEALAQATAKQAFVEADKNGDGKLNFQEFLAWYNLGGKQ